MQFKLQNLFSKKEHKYLFGAFGILALYGLTNFVAQYRIQRKYDKLCEQRREELKRSIQQFRQSHDLSTGLNAQLEKDILNFTISDIKYILFEKKATVKQVLLVFINRTLSVATSDNLNLITDVNFIEAIQEAEKFLQIPQIIYKYDLFGIPVSVKDTYIQKGFDNTYGLASRLNKPATYDGIQVSLIKKARGIIFVRSNLPQLAMTFESTNRIFGRSLNPWNKDRAVGGSSGGEAALQAARCSVIGMGSDIGGSIRIPAAFCGVYGFKPSMVRQTEVGEGVIEKAASGMVNIRPSKGPLGRSVDDLIVMLRVLFDSKSYSELPPQIQDPYWYPRDLDFTQNAKKDKLRIGYIEQFNDLLPPNCMKRAVKEACQALKDKGHEIVEINLDTELEHELAVAFPRLVAAEGGFKSFGENLKGEKIIEEYELMETGTKIPVFLQTYILAPLLRIFGQKTLYVMSKQTHGLDVYQFLVNSGKQKRMNFQFLQYLKQNQIDAVIVPGFGCPAVKHGASKVLPLAALYTWMWNTVDVPAGSMPITRVQGGEDLKIDGKERTIDLVYIMMNRNMQNAEGLPVNIQVISYPNQEEMVLRVMKEIEGVIKFSEKHPYPY
ncbi:unnamed protein product (macronuclear) [Paramecium tetraurelia]|uniref:Amidase domain-containing protein n=1 Tax=Paramecium tetraurelia TaxID=5888 RepID=A0BYG3_PARTE|nr:uncharacterized protein GSPATT00033433001 [Paramecium tetraurelia]CAK63580.1 unnamed protein product [Paramecium tetraurelia]|eukprot:XP_001430978.1 hypothetical protein (macronuclear) [Paramecium tetraurelia strain d4-2]